MKTDLTGSGCFLDSQYRWAVKA